jgi:hypothetical protein
MSDNGTCDPVTCGHCFGFVDDDGAKCGLDDCLCDLHRERHENQPCAGCGKVRNQPGVELPELCDECRHVPSVTP